jgi:serine/threonine-protein kinase
MTDPATIGKYRIDSVLGKGAMGVVYKAFDPGIERAVAIKTVRKDLVDPDIVEQSMARFKNEARAAGRLLHPNIVSVYEYGEDYDNAFIVMEYVQGTGLRDFLNRGAAFDLAQVATIMTQLLLALDFAHERGVIHRDIKPANLILTESGTLKVADFGIARIDTSSLTSLGMVMGTPSYMSPEQCQGLVVDRRSDLFSAAVVFYELVAGEKPFSGALETIAYKICHEDPRPPSTVSRLALSPVIDAVIATALEKNPDARFQNAKALSRPLRQACDALPT